MPTPGTGVFHPNFFYLPRRTVETAMISWVSIARPTGKVAQWDPDAGMEGGNYEQVWLGNARIQPNKDWRARPREQVGEFEAVHAIRVQIPINKNHFGSTLDADGKIVYAPDPLFAKDWVVRVEDTVVEGAQNLIGDRYYIRNAKNSANLWVYNLLCDTGTK